MRYMVFLLLMWPLAAQAEEMKFDPQVTLSCLEDGGWTDCIGASSSACMALTPGGYSTLGMITCIAAETEWWDRELNTAYQQTLARDRDDEDSFEPLPDMPPRPSMNDSLRDVQRAWIAFRDLSCHYEELRWWGGSGARLAGAGCIMRMTGEQALRLRSYLAEG